LFSAETPCLCFKVKNSRTVKTAEKSKKQEALLSLLNTNFLSRFFFEEKEENPLYDFKKKVLFYSETFRTRRRIHRQKI